jgi:predicted O-linked N-acetylglucosamine transferase (SPINDLY family)
MAYLTVGLFEQHDKSRFETTAISFGPDPGDQFRKRLENSFDRFLDVQTKNDRDLVLLLRELEIDIAVDLMGYTNNSRPAILALRPAPVQVNFLGYAGTMGADTIDYIIADRFIIPEACQSFYTENIVYLPDTYLPTDSTRSIGEHAPARGAAGLPESGFVFCCFNNNYKITPPIFDIWMRLLLEVEGSVLWLVEDNAAAVGNLRHEAEGRGVAPERLVFAPRVKLEDYLARLRLADVFLDTLPYNAHTTASDALWAGLPVVTCAGSSFAARVAGSLLNAVGLPELITGTLEDYEALALKLARDRDLLAHIKSKLARNRQSFPLFDTERFRRHIESAYQTMWERHQRGEPPASFAVASVGDE